jgi:hypothetical protein
MAGPHALDVVLVHGGFVDGAGWEGVYRILMIPPAAQRPARQEDALP